MKLKTKTELLATNKVGLITYCQDLHLALERSRIDASRYWRNRIEQAAAAAREAHAKRLESVAAEREACADLIQGWNTAMTDKLADAIRARGAKGGEKC